jgi:glutaredoxin
VARPLLTMYSRKRCGLCDEAREVIVALLEKKDFEFEEVFIDGNEELELAYGLRVPVVLLDGAEEFETRVESDLLREALGGAANRGD